MPKHAVNVTEQARIRKLYLAGNSTEAIAAHMNVERTVVEAWHPDKVMERKKEIRLAEAEAEKQLIEDETRELATAAATAKRSEAAKKAAATRAANRKAEKDAAKLKDQALAEAREEAQRQAAEMQQE